MLCRLVKGERINIFIGERPNAELLFSAPAKLLKKFSGKWNHELTDKNTKTLYVFAHKEAVKFVIEWMAGGGRDNAKGVIPYPKNDLLKLLCLNKLVVYLEIPNLKDRTLRDTEALTKYGSVSSNQIARAFAIAQPLSQARAILEKNLTKWVASFNKKDWEAKCQLACNKAALGILTNLRSTAMIARAGQKTQNRGAKKNDQDPNHPKRAKKAVTPVNGNAFGRPEPTKKAQIGGVTSGPKDKRAALELPNRSKKEKIKPIPKGQSLIKAWREGKIAIPRKNNLKN